MAFTGQRRALEDIDANEEPTDAAMDAAGTVQHPSSAPREMAATDTRADSRRLDTSVSAAADDTHAGGTAIGTQILRGML